MQFTADALYGGMRTPQPDPAAAAAGAAAPVGVGEPGARTVARPRPGFTGNPTFALVAVLALAFLLNFSFKVEVSG